MTWNRLRNAAVEGSAVGSVAAASHRHRQHNRRKQAVLVAAGFGSAGRRKHIREFLIGQPAVVFDTARLI
ncbi:hypothetical protein [Paenibacillus jilunlii]|uniref:hypothetical protein n=1 Tax=Paenibacillus jilunlii TaxID=682956 RepID=UPI00115FB074|nr:hypothetical protein [Paenibacillus jilunlii]